MAVDKKMAKRGPQARARTHAQTNLTASRLKGASGTITLPPGAIPSPSGGKSSAFDFSTALMQGNPVAVQAVEDAMRTVDWPLDSIETKEEEASVADKFIASTYDWCKTFKYTGREEKIVQPILMAYRQAMRKAHRFVLDNEFTRYATEISNRVKPEKLLARIGLATLPYEVTWIEFDLHTKVRVMRAFHGLEGIPDGVSPRMGILLERINDTMCTVTMVGEETGGRLVVPTLTGYVFTIDERTLHFNQRYNGMTPFDAAYRSDRLKGMPEFKDVMSDPDSADLMRRVAHGSLWGYGRSSGVLHSTKELMDTIDIPSFLMRHGELAFSRFYDFFENAGRNTTHRLQNLSKVISDEVTEFAGMMRWIVCVLAMLNEVPTRANFVQPMHTMRWGLTRKVAAFDYHRLTLRLPKTRALPYIERKLSNVERKHKAHEVRQHWRTYLHPDKQCRPDEHDWVYDEEHGYALCGKCEAYRRRIPEHVRGDASLGWVRKEYVIKPSKQDD